MSTYSVYVINFKDEERRTRMTERFNRVNKQITFTDPVTIDDVRMSEYDISVDEKRVWAIFFQHLDSIIHFYENTTDDYCIVCEDDVMISKDLDKEMPEIMETMKQKNLDILLLSYLWQYPISKDNLQFPFLCETPHFQFRGYPFELWGSHMYMVSRSHAKNLIDIFSSQYVREQKDKLYPLSPDWQMTKMGNRGIIIPMVGVEEGNTKTDHVGQQTFHRMCFEYNYKEGKHF